MHLSIDSTQQCILCTFFWLSLLQILLVDIVLSVDNAIIISLATRSLPSNIRRKVVLLGIALAIILRIVFTIVATHLLIQPYLKAIGGIVLFIIAIQLLIPKKNEKQAINDIEIKKDNKKSIISSIMTILIADAAMSLDNVLAIAGIAHDHTLLLILGLLLSIPLIMVSSDILSKLIQRFPFIIDIGSAILTYTSAKMIMADHAIIQSFSPSKSSTLIIPILVFFITISLAYIIHAVLHENT